MPTICSIADDVVGPASAHRAAVLALNTETHYTIGVVAVFRLAVLARKVDTVAPPRMIPISTDCVEAWALRLALTIPSDTKHVEKILLLNTFSTVMTAEEFRSVVYRRFESMWRQAV